MNKKELKMLVDEKHTYSICGGKETVDKKTGKTKVSRYHTRLDNGIQVYASRKDDLYRKLFEYYYGNSGNTLESLFEPYLEWKKRRLNLVVGTIKRERNKYPHFQTCYILNYRVHTIVHTIFLENEKSPLQTHIINM